MYHKTKDAGRRAMQMEEPLNIERDVVGGLT